MSDTTTITVTNQLKDDLDAAATAIFGTTEVPYRVTLDRLLKDHDDVDHSDDDDRSDDENSSDD